MRFSLIMLVLMFSLMINTYAYAEKRIALVIGNSSYSKSPLKNPVNDANAMAAALKKSGFEVIKKTNLTRKQMRAAIRDYGDKLKKSDAGLFYYAGHGAQVDGENYLIPLGAEIAREDEISDEAVGLNALLRKITSASNALNMIILDACRDNPFGRAFSRSSSRGLARVNAPSGTVVIYAAAPGQTSSDGSGNNGLFTEHFLTQMKKPGVELGDILRKTGRAVYRDSNQKQEPFVERSLLAGEFYFNQASYGSASHNGVSNNQSANQTQHMGNLKPGELSAWRGVRQCDDIGQIRQFINDFPDGTFTAVAKNCLDKLTQNERFSLYIDTIPSDAMVKFSVNNQIDGFFDNKEGDYEYGQKFKAGSYKIKVSAEGFKPKSEWITLSQNKYNFFIELNKSIGPIEVASGTIDERLTGMTLVNNKDNKGVLVKSLIPNSKAVSQGLKMDDVIIAVNRSRINNIADLRESLPKSGVFALNIVRANISQYLLMR